MENVPLLKRQAASFEARIFTFFRRGVNQNYGAL